MARRSGVVVGLLLCYFLLRVSSNAEGKYTICIAVVHDQSVPVSTGVPSSIEFPVPAILRSKYIVGAIVCAYYIKIGGWRSSG